MIGVPLIYVEVSVLEDESFCLLGGTGSLLLSVKWPWNIVIKVNISCLVKNYSNYWITNETGYNQYITDGS